MRPDRLPRAGIAWSALLLVVCAPDVLASDMAGIGIAGLLLAAWGVLAVLNLLVTLVVVTRRMKRHVAGAGWYLLVPIETALFTGLAIVLIGHDLADRFFLFAVPIPLAAWGLAHVLHREREPEFRYRPKRYPGHK